MTDIEDALEDIIDDAKEMARIVTFEPACASTTDPVELWEESSETTFRYWPDRFRESSHLKMVYVCAYLAACKEFERERDEADVGTNWTAEDHEAFE